MNSLQESFTNCAALAVAETVAAPLERCKLLMQVEHALPSSMLLHSQANPPLIAVARRLLAHEKGILPLFRGNSMNVAMCLPSTFVVWSRAGEMLFVPLIPSNFIVSQHRVSTWAQLTASSILFLALVYPLVYLRTAMAVDVVASANRLHQHTPAARHFGGYRACLVSALSPRGRPGGFSLYAGFSAAAAAAAVYRLVHMVLADTVLSSASRPSTSPERGASSLALEFTRSWGVAFAAGLAAYPFDTVSRWCIVTQAFTQVTKKMKATAAAAGAAGEVVEPLVLQPRPLALALNAYRLRGLSCFFRGVSANVLRSAIVIGTVHAIAPIQSTR